MTDRSHHLTLELDSGADPIAGLLRAPDGSPHAFTGYVGLIAALESTRAALGPLTGEPREGAGSESRPV